jgi:hypothetical protein
LVFLFILSAGLFSVGPDFFCRFGFEAVMLLSPLSVRFPVPCSSGEREAGCRGGAGVSQGSGAATGGGHRREEAW